MRTTWWLLRVLPVSTASAAVPTSGPILSRALPPGYEIPSFPRQGRRQQTGARPHGFHPELHAVPVSHRELPVAGELLVVRELPSSCVVTNVAGTDARGRKVDDAGYLVNKALAPSLG